MILSSFASTLLEDVALAAQNSSLHLWMQTYIFDNRTWTTTLVRRAEMSGFKGIVLTADSPIDATVTCNVRMSLENDDQVLTANIDQHKVKFSASATFKDIAWLKRITKLPIIVKGLLSGEDAKLAILAGASAILVSNHGGRQMDGDPATIDALPAVVEAVNRLLPRRDVFLDGGVRSGHDIYKALARGAKMVFVGRPIIWGLALGENNKCVVMKNSGILLGFKLEI
ncbi:hydroxyacid oxidase 1 [Caerostris extrusa]|uniref:Hydroxyacid oxidase 1 n=1 Tax=Caerostris extrusa TaxID=172846 RepID=A0AAV4PLR9_CAEEX|nr:hydroxyacid oxidase 1 [Caerostris extrusa]